MSNFCEFFPTEYDRSYRKKKIEPAKIVYHEDYFTNRIEEGEIDPRIASIPKELDETAKQLVYKHILNNLQSVYQINYKSPWISRDEIGIEEKEKEKDLQSELLAYIHDLYFKPHTEKVLAPPVTAKRMLGYIRPQLLHANLSMYQHTFNRTGATVLMEGYENRNSRKKKIEETKNNDKKLCTSSDYEN